MSDDVSRPEAGSVDRLLHGADEGVEIAGAGERRFSMAWKIENVDASGAGKRVLIGEPAQAVGAETVNEENRGAALPRRMDDGGDCRRAALTGSR